jgi:hypothetical protein
LCCLTLPASAQDHVPQPPSDDAGLSRQVYGPEYFTAYAPRNAFDMLERLPGFTLEEADEARGLGQASGNVLLNGARLAGKSTTAEDQLKRINAGDVLRIEVLDGATLDIPGLSGQVANVVTGQSGLAGQFNWQPTPGNKAAGYNLTEGDISVSASLGRAKFNLALSNPSHHGGSIGPSLITAGDGTLIDSRRLRTRAHTEAPTLSASVQLDLANGAIANLSASHLWDYFHWRRREERMPVAGDPAVRHLDRLDKSRELELGADIQFPLGPGRLKLIGLNSSETRDYSTESVFEPSETSPASGDRYELYAESSERIGRAEYGWPMLGGDWQLSTEAAYNRLDNISSLFAIDADGVFASIPFPAGTGGVKEDRYETILSYGRPITGRLSLQLAVGGEYSKLVQTGSNAEERSFRRPKGSLSLAWAARPGLDMSLRLNRRVGQLDFADFLAQVFVDADNQNAGNNQLVPEQSWVLEYEVSKDFGKWGSARLKLVRSWIEDVVTYIPIPGGGESLGNVDRADRKQLTFDSTLKLEPLGIAGARFDLLIELEDSSIADPLTSELRPIDETEGFNIEGEFRHDIPRSNWAWGFLVSKTHLGRYYRIFESGETDGFRKQGEVYVEQKDLFGLTVRATASNLFSETSRTYRTLYEGPRNAAPVLFSEKSDRSLYPSYELSIKGSF